MDAENPLVTPPSLPPQIRMVDASRGVEWIAGGFRMFMKAPGPWLLVALALIVGVIVIGIVGPGWLHTSLVYLIGTVAVGVLMRSCQMLEQGGDFVAHMQTSASSKPLWILGLIAAGLNIGLSVLAGVLGVSSFAVVAMNPTSFYHVLGLSFLVFFVASILMTMALWLAPALVVFKGVAPLEAVKLSFQASLKNLIPYIVYSVLGFVLSIFAMIPIGLGFLVLIPVFICGWYLAYKDIFEGESTSA